MRRDVVAGDSVWRSFRREWMVFLLIAGVSTFSLRGVLFSHGVIAVRDLSPMWRFEQLSRPFDVPWDYKSNLGSPSLLLGNAVYNLPLIVLSALTGCVALAHKLWFVAMFTLAGYGFYVLFKQVFGSREMGLLAGVYGVFNSWLISRVGCGHNLMVFSYALLPFAFSSYLSALETRSPLNLFMAGLLGASVTYISPHMGYLLLVFALVYALVESVSAVDKVKALYSNATCLAPILFILFVVLLPVTLPLAGVSVDVYAIRREEMTYYTLNLGSVTTLELVSLLQTLIIVSAGVILIAKRASPLGCGRVRSLALTVGALSVGGVLLYSGAGGGLLLFMFDWIPGFSMFRELSKTLVYAVYFTAFMLAVVVRYARWRFRASKALPLALAALLLAPSAAYPIASGDFAGSVKTVWVPWYYDELYRTMGSEGGYFRVAFFPPATWATHYNWSGHYFLDPIVSLQAKPTLEVKSEQDLTLGASFTRWAYLTLYKGGTARVGSLLGLMGVKYVVLRRDADMLPERTDLVPFRLGPSRDMLRNAVDLVGVRQLGSLEVYQTPYSLPHMYTANRLSLVVGDRRALLSLPYLDSCNPLSSPPIFIDNLDAVAQILSDVDRIFLDPSRFQDLVLAVVEGKILVRTWEGLPLSSWEREGWIRGDLAWYLEDGVADVAPDGYALTNGENTLTVSLRVPSSGNYTLLVQAFFIDRESFKGFHVSVDDGPLIKIEQLNENPLGRYKWVAVGEYSLLEGAHKMRVLSDGGFAAISKIALVPQHAYERALEALEGILVGKKLIYVIDDYAWPSSAPLTLKGGHDLSNGLTVRVPDREVSFPLYIPRDSTYELHARLYGNGNGNLSVRILDEDMKEEIFNKTFSVTGENVGNLRGSDINLNAGWSHLTMAASGEVYVDLISLSPLETPSNEPAVNPNVTMMSGSSYSLNGVNANYIVFLEGWSPDWRLKWGDRATAPMVALGFANLFKVSMEGAGNFKIEFEGARLTAMGFWMTIALLSVSAVVASAAVFLKRRGWGAKSLGVSGRGPKTLRSEEASIGDRKANT